MFVLVVLGPGWRDQYGDMGGGISKRFRRFGGGSGRGTGGIVGDASGPGTGTTGDEGP